MTPKSLRYTAWGLLAAFTLFVVRPPQAAATTPTRIASPTPTASPSPSPSPEACCEDGICCTAGTAGGLCCTSGTSGGECLPPPPPVACAAGSCGGDCNADGRVTVDELVRGVNIGLGAQPVASCAAMDNSGNGAVTVDELVRAVGNALNGCPRAERYAGDSLWLCRPGLADDQCLTNDLDATVYASDGSLVGRPHRVADDPPFDCFYVYPTVDLSGTPGNHTDFSDIRPMLDPLLSQAAPFTGLCRVFAPLYRQVTIGTFGSPEAARFLAVAYGDVREAFRYYMDHYNGGRDVVIMGHSQGTFMTSQLLREEFDPVPAMRERLIVALLIGGSVVVPQGQSVGGSFQNIPLCTSEGETGCVIAYRTYAEGFPPEGGSNVVGGEGMDTACTNPAALAGGRSMLVETYFPARFEQPGFNVRNPAVPVPSFSTFFLVYPDFYTAECVKDDNDRSYLEIGTGDSPGDVRQDPILYTHPVLAPGFLGTHVIDYNFALGDLLELVEVKAQAMRE